MLPKDGILTTTAKTTLYAVTESNAVITNINFVNTHSGTVTLNVYLNASGTSRYIGPKNIQFLANYQAQEDVPINMETGDYLEAESSVANVIHWVVSGKENV